MSMKDDKSIMKVANGEESGRSSVASSAALAGLSRSKSFAGLLAGSSRRSSNSNSGTMNRESSSSNKRSSWFGSPLSSSQSQSGSTMSLNGGKQHGYSSSKPKEPRPQRATMIAGAIGQGIREAILVTEEDISVLKSSLETLSLQSQQSQGRTYDLEKQLKAAERYLKRLDYHLSALDELQEAYNVQSRLREGVRAMGKAYVESLGRARENALASVRSGFKECNEAMCALEGQLEHLLGALHVQMKGLQGFARLCPGDVFEITIRHGTQKWRTKGKIARDGTQHWDLPKFTFKAFLDELLFIRAIEIRKLGKQVLLGNKYCETLDLFCAQPQMMTVNLNTSGSLKLNLVVTWDPLYGNMDDNTVNIKQQLSSTSSSCSSPLHRQRSINSSRTSPLGTMSMVTGSIAALSIASYESEGMASPENDSGQSSTASAKSSTLSSASPVNEYKEFVNHLQQEQKLTNGQRKDSDAQDKNKTNGQLSTSLPDMEKADKRPSYPDYGSDSASDSRESLSLDTSSNTNDQLPAEDRHVVLATAVVHEESSGRFQEDSMPNARRDTTGNFLLVRRNDMANSGAGSWWQQKYYSSPTHTVDSGYDENVQQAKRSHVTLDQVFTEEDEIEVDEAFEFSRSTENVYVNSSWRLPNGTSQPKMTKATWLPSSFGQSPLSNMNKVNANDWDKEESDSSKTPEVAEHKDQEHDIADWTKSKCSLESALQYVKAVIADVQGQYPELETFERSVTSLYDLLKVQMEHGGSSSSLTSLTVESVLECFDFLDNEESDGNRTRPGSPSSELGKKVTFSPQLDMTLLIHLMYSRHLVERLGAFGPLKCRERQALAKLQVQGRILNKLSKLIEKWQNDPSYNFSALAELNGLPHLQKLWGIVCSGSSHALCVSCEDVMTRLLPLTRSSLNFVSDDMQRKVLQQLIARCQDLADFNPSWHLTVFQFRYFVRSKERSFQIRLEEIKDELEITNALMSSNPQHLQKTLMRLSLMGPLPSINVLLKMSHLLLDPSNHPNNPRIMVASYLKNSAKDDDVRQKLLDTFVDGLESSDADDRQGSCEALGILQAKSAVHQLAYMGQSDTSAEVRARAKSSLLTLGGEGRDALEQIQLSSHGFQGIAVK